MEYCMMCFYSEISEHSELFKKLNINGKDHYLCTHPNSPFFNELVEEDNYCRLFLDEKEYFKMKDRRERLTELKNKSRGGGNKNNLI